MVDEEDNKNMDTRVAPKKQARPKVPQKQWWRVILSVLGALVWVGVSVFASQIVVGQIMLWILGEDNLVQPVWTTVYSAISYLLAMVLVIFVPPKVGLGWKIVNKKKGKKLAQGGSTPRVMSREELGLKGWPTWTDIGLALVGFFAYMLLAAGVLALFVWMHDIGVFPWFEVEEAQDVGFNVLNSGLDKIVAFITLVVVAPIAEEIIFRGWLYGKLRRKFSEKLSNVAGMILSILLVSVLFGMVHLQWNVGVNVFALSVVLCSLREITGTIYAGILLHMLKNGVAFYFLYVAGVA